MKFNHLNQLQEKLNSTSLKDVDTLTELFENASSEFSRNIIEASETEVSPESDDGKKIISFASVIRKFGYKLLNLLEIRFSISFAGVTLVNWTFPKVNHDTNEVIMPQQNVKKL